MFWKAIFLSLFLSAAQASKAPGPSNTRLSNQLETIRVRVISLQQELLDSMKLEKQAKATLKKIRALMKLQQEERDIGRKRIQEFEATLQELESRRKVLGERILSQQKSIHSSLIAIEQETQRTAGFGIDLLQAHEQEKLEAPRRKVLSRLVSRSLREVEGMREDLRDSEKLEDRINLEKRQLAYLFQDLDEKESVLELNRQLQADLLKKNHDERVEQLESYRNFKKAEAHVEDLIKEFSAKVELERATETERVAQRSMSRSLFASLQGRLPMPVNGAKILSAFGRAYDPRSRLFVFKKGIDIDAGKKMPVRAISGGKTAFSGTLPDYGQITIIDHGDHFYSLCAHLGTLMKKAGEAVAAGDVIGATDDSGTPVYFEIRARNVAVNPLQWISN